MEYNEFKQYLLNSNAPSGLISYVEQNEYSLHDLYTNAENIKYIGWLINKSNLNNVFFNNIFTYIQNNISLLQDHIKYNEINNALLLWNSGQKIEAMKVVHTIASVLDFDDQMLLICILFALYGENEGVNFKSYKNTLNGICSCITRTQNVITPPLIRSFITEQQIIDNL